MSVLCQLNFAPFSVHQTTVLRSPVTRQDPFALHYTVYCLLPTPKVPFPLPCIRAISSTPFAFGLFDWRTYLYAVDKKEIDHYSELLVLFKHTTSHPGRHRTSCSERRESQISLSSGLSLSLSLSRPVKNLFTFYGTNTFLRQNPSIEMFILNGSGKTGCGAHQTPYWFGTKDFLWWLKRPGFEFDQNSLLVPILRIRGTILLFPHTPLGIVPLSTGSWDGAVCIVTRARAWRHSNCPTGARDLSVPLSFQIFRTRPDRPWSPPSLMFVGYLGLYHRKKSGWDMKLITHPLSSIDVKNEWSSTSTS